MVNVMTAAVSSAAAVLRCKQSFWSTANAYQRSDLLPHLYQLNHDDLSSPRWVGRRRGLKSKVEQVSAGGRPRLTEADVVRRHSV